MGVFKINVLNDFDVLDVVVIADVVAKQIYGTGVYFKKYYEDVLPLKLPSDDKNNFT